MAYADAGQTDKAEGQAQILDNIDSTLHQTFATTCIRSGNRGCFLPLRLQIPFLTKVQGLRSVPGMLRLSRQTALQTSRSQSISIRQWTGHLLKVSPIGRLKEHTVLIMAEDITGAWLLPDTEVTLPSLPKNVLYDAESNSAKVMFTVNQNADATGTIDPAHLLFGFYGKDAYGNTMDTKKDEYLGLSIIV
jgi:hypothetical protein